MWAIGRAATSVALVGALAGAVGCPGGPPQQGTSTTTTWELSDNDRLVAVPPTFVTLTLTEGGDPRIEVKIRSLDGWRPPPSSIPLRRDADGWVGGDDRCTVNLRRDGDVLRVRTSPTCPPERNLSGTYERRE